MIDQLTYVNDAHVRTLIAGLDRAVTELTKAAPVGWGVVFFRKRTNLLELAGNMQTAADYLAELRFPANAK